MTATVTPPPLPTADGGRATPHVRVAIVGSGFAGLGLAHELRQRGIEFLVFERAADVGGTWRDNSYPGCRCDVPSHLYSLSTAPNPDWTETYSRQGEIWDYMRSLVDRFGVRDNVRLEHEVTWSAWDDDAQRWHLETTGGDYTADVLVLGNGPLAEPAIPVIPGLDTFEGPAFHSAQWRHDVDLTGKRVAVIGTGASAIQFVPAIQPQVDSLLLFQRTPAWVLPHTTRPIPVWKRRLYRRAPTVQKLLRNAIYWTRELSVFAFAKRPELMDRVKKLAQAHLADQVADPELRAALTPAYSPGCKRLLLSNDYYPAVAAPNVTLRTDGIAEVRPHAVVTPDGVEHPVDVIIHGTGFHVTDNPVMSRVAGRDGATLAKVWAADGMRAHLGTTVPGFPNLFLLAGPNTGIGHTSLVYMIESQYPYVLQALDLLDERNLGSVEVEQAPFERYNDDLQRRMKGTVWMTGGCHSWYLDDHGRNPTIWPDFTFRFRRATRRFDAEHYDLTARRPSHAAGEVRP